MDKEGRGQFKEKVSRFFKELPRKMKDLLYPENITCDLCGEELKMESRYNLCSRCIEKLPFIDGDICLNCGVSIDNEAEICDRCQNNSSVFKINRSPLIYDGSARDTIHALKFGGKKYLVKTIGAMMADAFLKYHMEGEIIVPVPMTDEDERKRGFNQAELLAYEVGARLNIPVLPALKKTRVTSNQKELSGKDRRENLEKAFEVVFPQVKDRKILLIDDIFTTGATANECAKALLKGKCREVSVLTACITKLKPLME
ncbi:MAG: ComF family protein [Clostridia bacterium]|nr:ComF family protein [Clostridia bacterium]